MTMPIPHSSMSSSEPCSTAGLIQLPAIGVLGAGSMGQSLIAGLVQPGVHVDGPVMATCQSAETLERLRHYPGIHASSLAADDEANRRAASACQIVVLAANPEHIPELAFGIAGSLRPGSLVASIAAGIPLARLHNLLPDSCTVVRALPNVGGKVGLGVTGLGLHPAIPASAIDLARTLFSTVGHVLEVDDSQLDVISSLSGSGPAYFYHYVDQLASAAVQLGLDQDQARELAKHTFMGAAETMRRSGQDTGELLVEFSGSRTTTIKALDVLEAASLDNLLARAASAAIARAEQIAAETAE